MVTKWNKKWDAEGFTENPNFMERKGEANLSSRKWIVDFIEDNAVSKVVECGLATGIDLQTIVWAGLRLDKYVGLDITNGFKRHFRVHPPWFSFRLLVDPYRWPVRVDEFELAYSRHVIEHQPSPFEMLAQMARASSRWVAIMFFRPPTKEAFHKIQRLNDGFYFNDLSAALLEKEASEVGLELVERKITISATKEAKENELWLWKKK